MSAGTVHVKASVILASGFTLGAIIALRPELMLSALGAIVGTIITPDLDVDKAFIGDKIVQKKAGNFAKALWLAFWRPYKKSMKHGRFLSHFPIISTIVRLAYIHFLLITLPGTVYMLIYPSWTPIFVFPPLPLLYGLIGSDIIHYFLDILTTESKG